MYFSCIMFMVSSSCITTILILNYHHRYHHNNHHYNYHHCLRPGWRTHTRCRSGCRQCSSSGCPGSSTCPGQDQHSNTVLANTDSPDQQIYQIKVSDIQTSSLSRQSALSGALILFQHLYLFQAWRENHSEDNHDGQQDEGAGHEGDLL